MDLVETAEHYVLRADLPGLSDEDVSIQLEDNVLTISGERKTEHRDQQEGYYRLERAFGSFTRSLTLPAGVDPDSVQAHFDRGVLEIASPSRNRRSPRPSRSASAQTPTPRRSRAPNPKPTAATQSPLPDRHKDCHRGILQRECARTAPATPAVRVHRPRGRRVARGRPPFRSAPPVDQCPPAPHQTL